MPDLSKLTLGALKRAAVTLDDPAPYVAEIARRYAAKYCPNVLPSTRDTVCAAFVEGFESDTVARAPYKRNDPACVLQHRAWKRARKVRQYAQDELGVDGAT